MAKDTPGAKPLIILGVLAAALLIGLIYYTQRGPSPKYDPTNPPDIKAEKAEKKYMATFYNEEGQLVTEERVLGEGEDPVVLSVNDALASIPAVPPEGRLVETVRDGDTIGLKFTTNFNQTYGTDDEGNVIQAIIKAVDANSDAEMVTFLTVDNKPIETLGSIDLVGPQSVRDWMGG